MGGFNTLVKQPLNDKACERAVLGLALTYNRYLDKLNADLFHDGECKAILAVAQALRDAGKEADIVSIMTYSNHHQCGINPLTLTQLLSEAAPTAAFARDVEHLLELSARCKLQTLNYLIGETATNEALDVSETLAKVETQIQEISSTVKIRQDDYVIDLSVAYPQPRYTLEFHGVGCIPAGDIQGIVARQKQGKTHLCIVLATSILGCEDFGFKSLIPDARVLYADTEQTEADTAKVASKIHTLMRWSTERNNDRLRLICLRSKTVKERLPIIVREVKKFKPTALFVDGLVDLVTDFNDLRESSDVIQALMRLSADCNCAILCVLHLNKGKDDNNPRGHIGSFLIQKSSDIFQVTKAANGIFNVIETDCRHRPIDDFAFGLDGHGVPMKAASITEVKAEANTEALAKFIRQAFGQTREMSYSELRNAIHMYGGVSERTAERRIREATDKGLIGVTVNKDKYYVK